MAAPGQWPDRSYSIGTGNGSWICLIHFIISLVAVVVPPPPRAQTTKYQAGEGGAWDRGAGAGGHLTPYLDLSTAAAMEI